MRALRVIEIEVNGQKEQVASGSTLLESAQALGLEIPTLCFAENLTPVNVCRVCVVEVEGARTLVPACSRKVEAGMKVWTDSDRVRVARKLVLELIASSVDVSDAPEIQRMMEAYGADPSRFGEAEPPRPSGTRDHSHTGHHACGDGRAATVHEPPKVDNALFVRDYAKCMLCMKCVEACGVDAQNTFAIAIAGRGFEARVSTEHAVALDQSACVFCGNCISVCPTNALVFRREFELKQNGRWDESRQTVADTVCPYCGVGCVLTLRAQDGKIVRVTSPVESSVTGGHLCIKGRFGTTFVESE